MPVYISPPPRNPLVQLLAAVVAVLAMAGAFMLGLVALAVVAGVAIVIGLAAWLRGWRAKRQFSNEQFRPGRTQDGETIEAEYTVISRRNDSS